MSALTPPPASDRDAAFVDNVARHLMRHPQAEVLDDQGRRRPLTADEAERIARVTLRAGLAWLAPVEVSAAHALDVVHGNA